jgi:hypothetical protein
VREGDLAVPPRSHRHPSRALRKFRLPVAGRALAEAVQRDCAIAELQRAATDLGTRAVRYRDAAERELGRLGHRVYRRARPGRTNAIGIESLAERELQVARLVVKCKTNRQCRESCTSARRPLRPTCAISSTRSMSRHASAWRVPSNAPTERRARHRPRPRDPLLLTGAQMGSTGLTARVIKFVHGTASSTQIVPSTPVIQRVDLLAPTR